MVLRGDPRARHRDAGPRPPGKPGNARPLRNAARRRVDTLGRARCRPRGRQRGDQCRIRPAPRSACRSRCWRGSLPSQRAVISVAGHPYELAGSLSSALVPGPWRLAGFSQGYAVFTLAQAAGAHHGLDSERPPAARAGHLEHDEVRRDPARRAGVLHGDPFRRVGLRMERNRLGQRRRRPRRSRSTTSTSSSRSTSPPATMWSRSTTDHRTSCWQAFSAWARWCCSWRCSPCGCRAAGGRHRNAGARGARCGGPRRRRDRPGAVPERVG